MMAEVLVPFRVDDDGDRARRDRRGRARRALLRDGPHARSATRPRSTGRSCRTGGTSRPGPRGRRANRHTGEPGLEAAPRGVRATAAGPGRGGEAIDGLSSNGAWREIRGRLNAARGHGDARPAPEAPITLGSRGRVLDWPVPGRSSTPTRRPRDRPHGDKVVGAAIRTPPWRLVLSRSTILARSTGSPRTSRAGPARRRRAGRAGGPLRRGLDRGYGRRAAPSAPRARPSGLRG